MTEEAKYEECMERLRNKLNKSQYRQLTNREDGYEEGIRVAMSIVRSVFKSKE